MGKLADRLASRTERRGTWGRRKSSPVSPAPQANVQPNRAVQGAPSDSDLDLIPLSVFVEYELSDAETVKLRRRLYARNRTGKYFYRTSRFGALLAVVRFM